MLLKKFDVEYLLQGNSVDDESIDELKNVVLE